MEDAMRNRMFNAFMMITMLTYSVTSFAGNACDNYLNSGAKQEDKNFKSAYENRYKGLLAVQASIGQNTVAGGLEGQGKNAANVASTNAGASAGQSECSNHVASMRKNLNNYCNNVNGPSGSNVAKYNEYQSALRSYDSSCASNAAQAGAQGAANSHNGDVAGQMEGKGEQSALKKWGAPIAIGAIAGVLASSLMGGDDKKAAPAKAATTTTGGTTTTTAGTTTDVTLDKPSDTTTQTEQVAKIPTEQTTSSTAVANATADDPAYTGIGSAQGDSGELRDQSAGEFVTTFACFEGESDVACRARYACTADETMASCQARWDSGLVAVK